jgi:uncharacterized protein YqeY
MTKAALKNKEIELRRPVSPDEENQVLQTLVKQRTESIEMFEKGARRSVEKESRAGYPPDVLFRRRFPNPRSSGWWSRW